MDPSRQVQRSRRTVETDYFINYDTSTQKIGARLQFSQQNINTTESTTIKVPETIYRQASQSLNTILDKERGL